MCSMGTFCMIELLCKCIIMNIHVTDDVDAICMQLVNVYQNVKHQGILGTCTCTCCYTYRMGTSWMNMHFKCDTTQPILLSWYVFQSKELPDSS